MSCFLGIKFTLTYCCVDQIRTITLQLNFTFLKKLNIKMFSSLHCWLACMDHSLNNFLFARYP